ncbi:MFS general substrate transporter [Stipitochalara longipes BDJ]|nr:MFS general substrate transporter [Stipitochalara longipes BDJ]
MAENYQQAMATGTEVDNQDMSKLTAHDTVQDSDKDLENHNGTQSEDSFIDPNFQPGVQDIEAVTISWSFFALVVAYVMIWFVYFVQGLVSGISGTLLPYVTSAFAEHSLTPTTSVISAVIGGVTNLSIAKVLDIFGRQQGYLLCIVLTTIGLIMSAACNNVEAYAASQVFYTVGINGIGYSLSVFVADTSSLRHRGIMQALCDSPYLITTWIAGPISTAFLNGAGWRWAFGMESILVPVVTLPLFGLFSYHFMKAKKQGIVPKRVSGRTLWESLACYTREFDIIGLLLISAGVAFFLLPFNLYNIEADEWGSALIICFLVFGIVLMIAFTVWERFFAKVSFIPWKLLQDRTVSGACLLSAIIFLSNSCWQAYFSSYLQVVTDLSVTHASYVNQITTVGSIFFTLVAGAVISYTGRYKPVTLYFALPLTVLGLSLLIYFRQPNQRVGYMVMCQLFISFAGGILMVTDEIAIMAAAAEQQYFAISIAVLGLFGSIGSAIGLTISAAIWQNTLPTKLAEYLPADQLANLNLIYEDLPTQLSFPVGSDTRLAIQMAYGDAQKNMLIAATAVWAIGFIAVFMWRDINVIGIKQTKGHVV